MLQPIYFDEPLRSVIETEVVRSTRIGAVVRDALVFGGSGECPPDEATVEWRGKSYPVLCAGLEHDGQRLECGTPMAPGDPVKVRIDGSRRAALCRAHTALHAAQGLISEHFSELEIVEAKIVNDAGSIVLREVCDHTLSALTAFECWLNERLERDLAVRSFLVSESRFSETKTDHPPSHDPAMVSGQIRIVEIEGLHRQACLGPHLSLTGDCGPVRVQIQPGGLGNSVAMTLLPGGNSRRETAAGSARNSIHATSYHDH